MRHDPATTTAAKKTCASRLRFVLLPLLAVLVFATGCDGFDRRDVIVFGAVGPFETTYGSSTLQGIRLAQLQINGGELIDGRRLELRVLNDDNDRELAIALADSLYRDPAVRAVVGHVTSGPTIAAAPVYEQGLPAVATSATSPEISRLGDWIFRVASSDVDNAARLAETAIVISDSAGILYENDDYGRGLAQSFSTSYADAGGRIVESDPYLESTEDLTPYLERMRRAGVDLVFIAGLEQGGARVIRQAREIGLEARFLGGDGLEGLVDMGETYEGTLIGMLYHPDASPEAQAFAESFRAEYDREPDSFAALGYDATMLLKLAVERGGSSREEIRRALTSVGEAGGIPPYQGVSGTIRFDPRGDPENKEFNVGVIRDGRIVMMDSANPVSR